MRKLAAALILLLVVAGCSRANRITTVTVLEARDYQWHKVTAHIKVHWNIVKNADGTVTADGFVEPLNPKYGLYNVRLGLAGLAPDGGIVSSVEGRPLDTLIMPPEPKSYFRMTLTPAGTEKKFTVHGNFHYFLVGTTPNLSTQSYDTIPLVADEPY